MAEVAVIKMVATAKTATVVSRSLETVALSLSSSQKLLRLKDFASAP